VTLLARLTTSGALDPTWSGDGYATLNLHGTSPYSEWASAGAIDPATGKVYSAILGASFDVVRWNTDGSIDGTFGFLGLARVEFPGATESVPNTIAIDANGRIVVAGFARFDGVTRFALARFLSNGVLDTAFGTGGRVTTVFSPTNGSGIRDITILPNGRIVAAGTNATWCNGSMVGTDIVLARYMNTGVLDTSFGNAGRVITDFGCIEAEAVSVTYDSIGIGQRVMVAGNVGHEAVVVRYMPTGSLDGTYSGDGVSYIDVSTNTNDESAVSIALDSSHRAVLAYQARSSSGSYFVVVRLASNGAVDGTFGSGGYVYTEFSPTENETITAVAVTTTDKIVATGWSNGHGIVARYNVNGTHDNSFSGDGMLTLDHPTMATDACQSVLLDASGRVILLGSAFP
jgi:uncharacterized delta-60 repeat protein